MSETSAPTFDVQYQQEQRDKVEASIVDSEDGVTMEEIRGAAPQTDVSNQSAEVEQATISEELKAAGDSLAQGMLGTLMKQLAENPEVQKELAANGQQIDLEAAKNVEMNWAAGWAETSDPSIGTIEPTVIESCNEARQAAAAIVVKATNEDIAANHTMLWKMFAELLERVEILEQRIAAHNARASHKI